MNTQLAIQERDLELVVSEKTLGSLTTNAKQIRDIVMANLPKYVIRMTISIRQREIKPLSTKLPKLSTPNALK